MIRINDFATDLRSLMFKYGYESILVLNEERDEAFEVTHFGEIKDTDIIAISIRNILDNEE